MNRKSVQVATRNFLLRLLRLSGISHGFGEQLREVVSSQKDNWDVFIVVVASHPHEASAKCFSKAPADG